MKTSIIKWHDTNKELPPSTQYSTKASNGKTISWTIDEPLLVIWEGKIKPSRYNHDTQIWEGHVSGQVPEHWIMLKEIEILTEDK